MKVIFLDFDGVVVCLPRERGKLDSGKAVSNANPEPVAQLNRLVEQTGAQVVVSSTWRLHHSLEQLRGTLGRAGFKGELIGVTPDLPDHYDEQGRHIRSRDRGDEIQAWLAEHPEVESYVVLDDDRDLGPIPVERWIWVERGWFDGGLLPTHVEAAERVLLAA